MVDADVVAGRYRLFEPLGSGGYGTVYRAFDTELERVVALKMIRVDALTVPAQLDEMRVRFRREGRAAARLRHANVVAVYDVGENAAGMPFLVMEYAEGSPLHVVLRGPQAIPPEVRRAWMLGIARALAAAHEAGIVHRDLKPANVIVTDGEVKVLDFGIARLTDDPTITSAGVRLGTPSYMSPEQRRGERVDAHTDQFAWGLVAYEILTGRRVRDGGVDLAALPPGPRPIVGRALSPHPSDRFPDMAAVVRALEALPDAVNEPVTRVGPPPSKLTWLRVTVAVVLVGALGLATGAGIYVAGGPHGRAAMTGFAIPPALAHPSIATTASEPPAAAPAPLQTRQAPPTPSPRPARAGFSFVYSTSRGDGCAGLGPDFGAATVACLGVGSCPDRAWIGVTVNEPGSPALEIELTGWPDCVLPADAKSCFAAQVRARRPPRCDGACLCTLNYRPLR